MSTNIVNLVTLNQPSMEIYYAFSPPRHAEKAYQPNQGDKFPPLSTVPTTAGSSGQIILLLTNLRNQPPFVRAEVQLIDYDALLRYSGGTFPTPEVAQKIIANYPQVVIAHCAGMTPGAVALASRPNGRVTVRPLTGGHKAKAISVEDFVRFGGTVPA